MNLFLSLFLSIKEQLALDGPEGPSAAKWDNGRPVMSRLSVCCNHLGCVLAPLHWSFPVKAGLGVTQTGEELKVRSNFWERGLTNIQDFSRMLLHIVSTMHGWVLMNLLPWSWFQSLDIFNYLLYLLACIFQFHSTVAIGSSLNDFSAATPFSDDVLNIVQWALGCWRAVVSICRNQSWVRKINYPWKGDLGTNAGVNNCM